MQTLMTNGGVHCAPELGFTFPDTTSGTRFLSLSSPSYACHVLPSAAAVLRLSLSSSLTLSLFLSLSPALELVMREGEKEGSGSGLRTRQDTRSD